MFKPTTAQVDFPKLERKIVRFWQGKKIFEKSLKNRQNQKKFTFYDGPPFATGLPHYGHILPMTIKDAVTRYKTMQGFYVPRRLGWDCHGLPVEYEVEKELKISDKKQIEEMGIDKFCDACRKIVFRYTKEWEKTIDRMGRWVDKKNPYTTLDLSYMESILWVFKTIWDKGLIYRSFKSLPYCPRCATPLSNFETNVGYKDNVPDPSIYVKFELTAEPRTYFLVWTTTPWTLLGNSALALNPKIKYIKVESTGQKLILAKARLPLLRGKYKIIEEFKAQDLVGKAYKPLYEFTVKQQKALPVLLADFVSAKEGTGIVHIAPAFGEDDLELSLRENLPTIQTVNERGEFFDFVKPWGGLFVKKADPLIIEDLKARGLLYKEETIYHTYPFCWRCETPLIYYAFSTWFIKVSQLREKLVSNNEKIHWSPTHIKKGRFGKWLAEARDWAISRNRFWGAPIPLWQCGECKEYICLGSLAELEEKKIGGEKITDIHRPFIDQVKIRCRCGGEAKRVPEVLDCWFESGSMPYAQDHYPFEGKVEFEKTFPADFIAEGLDQTRGWFYTLHVLATILFDKPAFKNCIVNGIILDKEGKKLSKRLRNYPEPELVFEKYGADSMRLLLLSSGGALAEDLQISEEIISEVTRRVLLILWNVYNFFVTYANLWGWKVAGRKDQSPSILDQWILSRLNRVIEETTASVNVYNLPKAVKPLIDFTTSDLSLWYVRRSRDRVALTAESRRDKESCFSTLHAVLVVLTKLLAPFAPFISEEIYKNLTGGESVHLADWPKVDKKAINIKLEEEMNQARKVVELAHAQRKAAGIKVRQPLSFLSSVTPMLLLEEIKKIIAAEVNIKEVKNKQGKDILVELETTITPKLKAEGEAREIVRRIQEERKKLGTRLDEKVEVVLENWPAQFENYIKKNALVQSLAKGKELRVLRL